MAFKQSKCLFRYFGGKGQLAEWIISHFPEHKYYIEPFCGAGSVFFSKPRCFAELLNDLNSDIVNLFNVLVSAKDCLAEKIKNTPFSREIYNKTSIYEYTDNIERALNLLIRSYMSFNSHAIYDRSNSGFRSDWTRRYTIPAHDWARLPEKLDFFKERL